MKTLLIASFAAVSLTLPQIASAQNAPPPQKQQSVGSHLKNNLEQAGFTNVQVMPSSFLVKAKDKDGNPVMMIINPDSVTELTELSGSPRSSAVGESTATGASTANDHLNLTSMQHHELWQSISNQAAKDMHLLGISQRWETPCRPRLSCSCCPPI